jgi:hypothetical protein
MTATHTSRRAQWCTASGGTHKRDPQTDRQTWGMSADVTFWLSEQISVVRSPGSMSSLRCTRYLRGMQRAKPTLNPTVRGTREQRRGAEAYTEVARAAASKSIGVSGFRKCVTSAMCTPASNLCVRMHALWVCMCAHARVSMYACV